MKRFSLPILLSLLALSGCSSKDSTPTISCDDRAKVGGNCPGVTDDAVSTDGIACTTKVDVTPADLVSKASSPAGTCLVLGGGSYPAVTLAPGVSLIGKGSGSTAIEGITTKGAAAATIRGVKVGAGGIVVSGAGTLNIDKVLVSGATTYGIAATGTTLNVTASTIDHTGSFGLFSLCKADCLPSRTKLTLDRVFVHQAKLVGVWVHGGVDVTIDGVQIDKTAAGSFLYGRGLEIAEGATVDGKRLAVVDNVDVGIFVDGGSVKLTSFTASRNVRGVQLQAIPEGGGKLEDFAVIDNQALGIGIANGSKGLIVQGGLVASTKAYNVPVDIGGIQNVGDGINWLGGSEVTIASSVKIEGSARRPVIIDASSKGKFEGTLSGGDETTGLIVQGGLEASMPSGLSVASGVKTDVLTKDKSMPVAVAVAMMKAP